MNCAEVERLLWEYLDGALSPEVAGAVQLHVTGCGRCGPACRCCGALLVTVSRVLRGQPGAPEVLRIRIQARLSREG